MSSLPSLQRSITLKAASKVKKALAIKSKKRNDGATVTENKPAMKKKSSKWKHIRSNSFDDVESLCLIKKCALWFICVPDIKDMGVCVLYPVQFSTGHAVWHEPQQLSSELNNISLAEYHALELKPEGPVSELVFEASRDSDDALICCVENMVEDRIMDYGASFHATYCKEELERFKLRSGKVRLGNNKTLDIAGIGDVVLKTFFGIS
nr:retrovirus-related Pol polyprotein from transposon TNT 1-94 [Tanacetum cinerariifolium]